MATTSLGIRPSSSSSSFSTRKHIISSTPTPKPGLSWISLKPLLRRSISIHLAYAENRAGSLTASAFVNENTLVNFTDKEEQQNLDNSEYNIGNDHHNREDKRVSEWKDKSKPCELYVCNLPKSCDIPDLMEMFKPFGIIHCVEISRNSETGESRGCGYVTLGTVAAAKAAIIALDETDVGGREMRVKFAAQMNPKRRKYSEAMSTTPLRTMMYESPHKLYVGNLAWTVQPEDLRNYFSQFGNVTSARVVHDRKEGKSRAYGFLSFASALERDAAKSLNGTDFSGREMVIREGTERERY